MCGSVFGCAHVGEFFSVCVCDCVSVCIFVNVGVSVCVSVCGFLCVIVCVFGYTLEFQKKYFYFPKSLIQKKTLILYGTGK